MITPSYTVTEAALHTGRRIRVLCIGAGASGLLFAYKIKYNFYESDVELQIYEKNATIPGRSSRRRTGPKYATSPEIYDYFADFARKYDLEKHIRYDSRVYGATWDAEAGQWRVGVPTGSTPVQDTCHILINAGGILNAWRWPAIPGLDNFGGLKLHSADCDPTLDLEDKTVALIGNG
ncbi:hypothetical protein LTR10_024337 [Elasticomyces elasticus]|nr:hypothetical protein LTR10_024337 [Elasticomyces elasticus]KAK5020714.1 hypothetical protein LTS07_011472 [Exophiala sideris]